MTVSFPRWVINTRLKLFLALLVLAALSIPAVADEVDDLILDLKYGTSDVRADAAGALGEIGDLRAVDPLILALNDSYSDVREEAAEALGNIGDPQAVDPLILALNDSDSDVREEAAGALGNIGDPRAVEPLTYLASKDGREWVRAAAAAAVIEGQ